MNEQGDPMSPVAYVKAQVETRVHAASVLPAVLGVNTVVLVAYEQLYGIPAWVKAAAAFFLAF